MEMISQNDIVKLANQVHHWMSGKLYVSQKGNTVTFSSCPEAYSVAKVILKALGEKKDMKGYKGMVIGEERGYNQAKAEIKARLLGEGKERGE